MLRIIISGLPLVREKSGKFEVREKSGNFEKVFLDFFEAINHL